MISPSIFQYIKSEEARFETEEIRVGENWNWNFKNHVQMIFHLFWDKFYTGSNNWLRAFRSVMRPIVGLANWTEDIELKEVVFSIKDDDDRVTSFLIKKYHDEVFVKKHNLDEMFDEVTESDNLFGGALVQRVYKGKPETLTLQDIAFCDQTDILGAPIGFKKNFSPGGLRKMSKLGWGEEKNGATISINDLIVVADNETERENQSNHSTGKQVEVYIVRGDLPEHYLKDNDNMEDWYSQVQVVAFYTKKDGFKEGVILYRKKEDESNIKFYTSEKISGRALGGSFGEATLHPQIWTNFLEIHKMKMLESAAKSPLWTDDPNFTNRNQIQDMDNLEVAQLNPTSRIGLIPTINPTNIGLFERSVNELYQVAQQQGSAYDPMMGAEPVSGTTFGGQERLVAQGSGTHKRRKGKRAKFFEEIYRDWLIDDMVKEIVNGKKFIASLSQDEIGWIVEKLAIKRGEDFKKELLLKNQIPENMADLVEQAKNSFMESYTKDGNRRLIEILKDELKDAEILMDINIASKQQDLAGMADKVLSILQFAMANPQGFQMAMQNKSLAKAFNDILEFSGISPVNFSTIAQPIPSPIQPNMQSTAQELLPAQSQMTNE